MSLISDVKISNVKMLSSFDMKFVRYVSLMILSCLIYLAVQGWERGPSESEAKPAVSAGLHDGLTQEEQQTIQLFEAASPAVVYITSIDIAYRRDFFSLTPLEIPQGTGSGIVWSRDGYVVTNFHVVSSGSKMRVRLSDQTDWDASIVGAEPDKDLAVLKIGAPATALTPVQIGVSQDLRVGQKVFAIGNPFGFDQTLTTG
ncbi:MAG: trypsin-like peptidase domain-containing protein, partial [Bdellovibrionales bacterium]|nr:trypsin-like peptidase domain-containing protein [Bdellovibrionales bacterium]